MIRGSSSRVPGTSSGISITSVWPSNFSKTLRRATAGKAGIVYGRPWQSMMRNAGKVTALVCSEAIMMSIWTHCRDHLHGLQRKEALVSETNMGIVISGPLDLWLCSGYLPFCRYPPTGLPDVFALQHFPLASTHLGNQTPLLLAMLIIFPPNADFLANIVLVPIDSTRATLAPIHESNDHQTNSLIPVYHYQQSPFSIGLVIATRFFWPLVLSILLSGYPALLLASRFCLLCIARSRSTYKHIHTYTGSEQMN